MIRGDVVAARELAKKIQAGELKDGFTLREVYRHGWTGLGTTDDATAAVEYLLDLDWLAEVKNPTGGRTGTAYLINPGLGGRGGPGGSGQPESAPSSSRGGDRTDRSHDLAASESAPPPSGAGARTDRSPPSDPSVSSVSSSGGVLPEIQPDGEEDNPDADAGEATWTG